MHYKQAQQSLSKTARFYMGIIFRKCFVFDIICPFQTIRVEECIKKPELAKLKIA